jgi:O-6-methylguanine DNA methyltransferase
MLRRFPAAAETAPPPQVRLAIDSIVALLQGEPSDLSAIALDMEGVAPFHRRVYEVARTIPPGKTLGYGEVAARLGAAGAARAVGQALGHNPFPIVVPCHRGSGGRRQDRWLFRPWRHGDEAPHAGDRRRRMNEGLGFEPATAVEHLRASDESLARVIDSVGPFRLQLIGASSIFGALAQAIVYQQLNGKAAAAIFARFCALFPGTDPTAELVLAISEEELRGAGLSRSKLLSLRDLAGKTVSGEIPTLAEIRLMEDDAIIERLTSVRGIGRWTVEMLLIFRLGRPDVLPADDYGIRKGFARAYTQGELPARKDVEAYGVRWKPYRTVASWYLWRLAEQAPLQKSQ